MYLLIISLGGNWLIGLFSALAFGITSYNIDLLTAGHSTKMSALALAPAVLAGIVYLFKKKWLLGGGVFTAFLSMQLLANHVQITYYTLLMIGIYFLVKLVYAVMEKEFVDYGKAVGILVLGIGLAMVSNASRLWPTWEFSKETIRGKSELAAKADQGGGLSKDYLFGWSYGIGESLTLLVPRAYGGGAGETRMDTKFFELVSQGAPPAEKKSIGRQVAGSFYWGEQTFVGTAIYFGAIVCFLFLLGAWIVPGPTKWWLLFSALFALTLAWGKHFFLNDLLYSYMPLFNKFRAVSMALGVSQLFVAVLAGLGLQAFFNQEIDKDQKKKGLYFAAGLTGVLALMAGFSGAGSGANDAAMAAQLQMPNLGDILMNDRASMARSDAFRSLGFIAAAFVMLWFALKGSLKARTAVLVILALAFVDHAGVCLRTLSPDNYGDESRVLAAPPEKPFDAQIKQDRDLHYRVLDLSRGGPTANAITSYYHESMSGYSAAKLQLYQEVIDTFFYSNLGENLDVLGMFNCKYIVNQQEQVMQNPTAYGNAWFVQSFRTVGTAEAEIGALHTIDPGVEMVVQDSYADQLQGFTLNYDSTAQIRLTKYHPEKMEYEYSAASEQIAAFSEVYYPPSKGWKCYLNGEPAPDFFKCDYAIRGMRLPAGQNMKLEMRFEPESFQKGKTLSMIASLLALLLLIGGLYFWFKSGPSLETGELENFAGEEKKAAATEKTAKTKNKGSKKR
jgi:hypothetical protein